MSIDPRAIPPMTAARFYRVWFWISLIYAALSAVTILAFTQEQSAEYQRTYAVLFCLAAVGLFVAAAFGARRSKRWAVFIAATGGLTIFFALSVRGRVGDPDIAVAWLIALLILFLLASLSRKAHENSPGDSDSSDAPPLYRWAPVRRFFNSTYWRHVPRGVLLLQVVLLIAILVGLRDWIAFAISGLTHDGPVFRPPTRPELIDYVEGVFKEAGKSFLYVCFFSLISRARHPPFFAFWIAVAFLLGLVDIVVAVGSPIFSRFH
jgi:hypothetical protein